MQGGESGTQDAKTQERWNAPRRERKDAQAQEGRNAPLQLECRTGIPLLKTDGFEARAFMHSCIRAFRRCE
jgi:hypothetical protein